MTAPILHEDKYILKTDILYESESEVFLRVEKEYRYENVWSARNAYEEFFYKNSDDIDNTVEKKYFDKWINMIGNEDEMIVKMVYVYRFESLEEARAEEERYKKEEKKERSIRWEEITENEILDIIDDML